MSAPQFYIYRNGRLQINMNSSSMLPVTKLVARFFLYWKAENTFGKLAQSLSVYSQYRSNSPSHRAKKAVDIAIEPVWLMPLFWVEIHKYFPLNIYLSLHNRHIHIDSYFWSNHKNRKRLEMRFNNGIRTVNPLDSFINYIKPDWRNPGNYQGRPITNKTVIENYDFGELLNDYNSTFRLINLRLKGIKGIALYYLMQHFDEIIPENEKELFRNVNYYEVLTREAGNEMVSMVNDTINAVQTGYSVSKILLTLMIPVSILITLAYITPDKETIHYDETKDKKQGSDN